MERNIIKKSTIARKTITDKFFKGFFMGVCILCAAVIVMIVAFIVIKGVQPFFKEYTINGEIYKISFIEFLFGDKWNFAPNHYGAGYIIINTIYITILALLIAVALITFNTASLKSKPSHISFIIVLLKFICLQSFV